MIGSEMAKQSVTECNTCSPMSCGKKAFYEKIAEREKMEFVRVVKNEDDAKQAIFFLPENGKFYKYSYVKNEHAHETMVFECDENGEVENHMDRAAGDGYVPSWEIMGQVNV